jgi:preprotein translocase subunit SecE
VAESTGTAEAGGAAGTPAKRGSKRDARERSNPFARIVRFFREVVAELRKVIWPTRKELITYTVVVVVFVTIMVAIVAGMDLAFAKAVLAVFGRG